MKDEKTLERIKLLHPKLRDEAIEMYDEIIAALTGFAACRFGGARLGRHFGSDFADGGTPTLQGASGDEHHPGHGRFASECRFFGLA